MSFFDDLAPLAKPKCEAEGAGGYYVVDVAAAAAVPSVLLLLAVSFLIYKFRVQVLICLDKCHAFLNRILDIIDDIRDCLKWNDAGDIDDVVVPAHIVTIPSNLCDSEVIAMRDRGVQWV